MTTFENPNQPDKKNIEELYQKVKEVLAQDTGQVLSPESVKALSDWQEARVGEATDSQANTEVLVDMVKLFIELGRDDWALEVMEGGGKGHEGLLDAVEQDYRSFSDEFLQEVKELHKTIKARLGK